jgi:uncharacterized protein
VEVFTDILWQSWLVLGQMAPYLLLGFLVAGVLSVCISAAWIERHLGGRGLYPVGAASLIGVPLPLCSCGVIPVTASIRRHGASPAATTSFLISTPQTGVDSIAITYGLLGPVFAVLRPVIALVTGVVGGAAVLLLDRRETAPAAYGAPRGDDMAPPFEVAPAAEQCCTDCSTPASNGGDVGRSATPSNGSGHVVVRVLRYGFVTLPRDIGTTLLIGVAIAGLLGALIEPGSLDLAPGIGSILLMMAAAIPLYVCATASVPIAVGLIHVGVSPGAALAFLIAGPATNAATVTTLWRLVGRKVTLIYLGIVGMSAVVGGLLLDALLPAAWVPPAAGEHVGHEMGGLAGHLWAVALLAVLLLCYIRFPGTRRRREPETGPEKGRTIDGPPREVRMKIAGMSCSHCADAVRRALSERPGVRQAEVDLDAGRALVVAENGFDPEGCIAAVEQLGYGAEVVAGQ